MKFYIPFVLFNLICLSCIIYFFGFKSISGQAFIVTKMRANIELGALDIRYIDEKELLEFGKNEFAPIISRINVLEDRLRTEREKRKSEPDFDLWEKSFLAELEPEAKSIIDSINSLSMRPDKRSEYECATYTKDLKPRSALSVIQDKELIEFVSKNAYPIKLFDSGRVIAKTDSNGRFSAKLPLFQKGYIIAWCSRKLLRDDEEIYCWLEKINTNSVILSNDNLWK